MSEPRVIVALADETEDDLIWRLLGDLQTNMFGAGPVAIKFAYFGREGAQAVRPFVSSRWVTDPDDLGDLVAHARASCVCGCYVKVGDILGEALKEAEKEPVQAVVLIADGFYGDRTEALAHAERLRAAGTRIFVLQRICGRSSSDDVLRALAQTTDGAHHEFSPAVERVAERLPQMFEAIAHYAIGGPDALEALASPSARLLLEQMDYLRT